ncbi:PPE domain-containing protein [Mycobacterium alsense]|uniref:PPE domain-containing protein n=1 Tax=Mycobacterium alsense TaxID=324058 RepID=UPI0009F36DCF|nr:PPE domain-containing protein [Mycobacterium alsense]
MDFGALPPEVHSARMHSGSGAGSLLAAAEAWDRLAAAVSAAAAKYRELTTTRQAESHVAWLQATAALAAHTAHQARATAAAFESARAATVPPQEVVTNRAWRTSLAATNHLGQGAHAIAAAEADYDKMWARDAAAMYGYARAAATASALSPFTSPAAAPGDGGDRGDGQEIVSTGSELILMLPTALQALSSASPDRFNAAVLAMSSSLAELSSLKLGFARRASVPLAVAVTGAARAVWGKRPAIIARFGGAASIAGMAVPRAWEPAPDAVGTRSAAALGRRAGR